MNDINSLISISKYFGERFDLVQAGGGNSSLKLENDFMLVKSSGISLADISHEKGFSKFNYKKSKEHLHGLSSNKEASKEEMERFSKAITEECVPLTEARPSIESLFHCVLGKFVFHLHPFWLSGILSQKNAEDIITEKLKSHPTIKWNIIDYRTPGIELALEILDNIKGNSSTDIFFLKNHGIILNSNTSDEILNNFKLLESIFHNKKTYSDFITKTNLRNFFESNIVLYQSTDDYLCDYLKIQFEKFHSRPLVPDDVVYWGAQVVNLSESNGSNAISSYKAQYRENPKVVTYSGNIFFCNSSLSKAKNTEEVFKAHLMAKDSIPEKDLNYLNENEIIYLLNWEAEKYRKNLNQ